MLFSLEEGFGETWFPNREQVDWGEERGRRLRAILQASGVAIRASGEARANQAGEGGLIWRSLPEWCVFSFSCREDGCRTRRVRG